MPIPACPPAPPARVPSVRARPGTTDTHFHVFGPVDRYPLVPNRMYDPAPSPLADYLAVADTIGIARMVVVQASVYGTDNRCLVDTIAALGRARARGIAVVDQSVDMSTLRPMHDAGVRGIRFNAITGTTPIEWLPSLARMIEPLGWHVQLWIKGETLLGIDSILDQVPVPIVLDHLGQCPAGEGLGGACFRNILRRLERGSTYVKLVPYRVSQRAPRFDDVTAAIDAMVAAAPGRCLWGTDWPHIYLEGRPMPNPTDQYEVIASRLTDDVAEQVFVKNPAHLYGFL